MLLVGNRLLSPSAATVASTQGVDETKLSIPLEEDARVSGFAGWFTADFHGTEANPCPCPVTLSTGPENGYTHWGQQVFHLQVPHDVVGGGKVEGTIAVKRQKENVRLVSTFFFFLVEGAVVEKVVSENYRRRYPRGSLFSPEINRKASRSVARKILLPGFFTDPGGMRKKVPDCSVQKGLGTRVPRGSMFS